MAKGRKLKIFSFFAGCGILDLGFEKAGYDIEFVNEFFKPFQDAYIYSRKMMKIRPPKYGYANTDVNSYINENKHQLEQYIEDAKKDGSLVGFIGGPPCPDFSIAGKQRGRDGDNGKLSLSYISLLITMKPDFFLFENVKGLWKTARHREFYEELKVTLKNAGYYLTERLTNSLEFGVPQDRDRILLVGVSEKLLKQEFKGDDQTLLQFPWESKMKCSLEDIRNEQWPDMTPFVEGSVSECPDGIEKELTVQYWFEKNDVENHPDANRYFKPKAGLRKMLEIPEGDTNKKSYKRIHRWRYSPTVAYGNNEVHLHPYKARRLSVAEAMSLQSLPKEFSLPPEMTLTDCFKTIGNGVPFLLTIMASLAQQESQSLSQNVKLGLQFRYQAGKVQVNHNRFLGYTKDDEGNLVIVPEEAEIVLRIYREYLEGASLFQIGQGLEADGIKTAAGSDYWLQSTLKKILTNEKYIGDALLQKTYTVDFLNKKRVANNGIVPQYYVENSHPAIIPREKFMKVREEMYRRAHMECGPDQKRRIYSSRYALSSIVYCAHCNDIFRRINWNNRGCKSTVWRCLSRVEKDRPSCTARTVKEELLHEVVVRAVNEVITGSSSFIPALQASFERCLGDSNSAAVEGIDAHLLELQQELLKLANAKQNYETLADEIDELRAEKEELLLQEANKEGIRQRIADMMAYLQSEPEEVTEYSEALVRRMIEKITVYDDHFVVEFKSGIEITINE